MTEDFFLHWSSFLTQLWLFYRKNQNWRYEACLSSPVRTPAWEENCILKFWCTLIDPFLCFSQSMVNIPEFYTSSKQQGCSHSCPLLGSDPFFCSMHWTCEVPWKHSPPWPGLFVCYAEHILLIVACFVETCQLGLNPEGLLLLERGLYKLRHKN